jgi:membrane protease subunit HflC
MKNRLTVVVAALVVLVLLLQMTVYTVRDSQAAVLLTFGKPTSERHEAGLSFKWPWPIQKVEHFDARLQVLRGPLEEIITRDGHPVLVGSFALWRISSAKVFQKKFRTPDDAKHFLLRRLRNHQLAAIAATELGALVSTDTNRLRYEAVEERIRQGLAGDADAVGIAVAMVGIRRLSLPKSSTEAVFERMKADRRKLATKILQEGREKADAIRRSAEEQRSRLLVDAKKEARALLVEADRNAAPHYAVMAKDPELAVFLTKLEALDKLLRGSPTVIFDTRQPPFDLLRPQEKR